MSFEIQKPTGLTLDELRERPEFKILTAKQQMFCSAYIDSGTSTGVYDAVFAVNTAYGVKSNENARLLSYELRANRKIETVLDLHFGAPSKEPFLNKLQRKLEKTLLKGKELTVAEKDSIKLLFAMRGWSVPEGVDLDTHGHNLRAARRAEAETKSEAHKVGEIIHQDDGDYEVLAVESNGHVTSVKNLMTGEIENEF